MPNEPREPAVTEFEVLRAHRGDRFYREGETRTAKEGDVLHLIRNGTLRAGTVLEGGGLRLDGPTIGEFVADGYKARNYPPHGYASRSTDEEIAAAIAAEADAPTSSEPIAVATTIEPALDTATASVAPAAGGAETLTATEAEPMAETEKAAQAPANKAAPKPDNKAAQKPANKAAS